MITNPLSVAFIVLFVLWVISMIFIGVTLDRANKCHHRADILNKRCDVISDLNSGRFHNAIDRFEEYHEKLEEHIRHLNAKVDKVTTFNHEGLIYIIPQDKFFLDRSVNNTSTLYYRENIDQLEVVDENGEIIPITDPESVVGDALRHFGEMSTDPNKVYVRNRNFDVDFEIVRMTRNV